MAKTELRDVTVIINHFPCEGPVGCEKVLPVILPEGATLTVYGVGEDGTEMIYRYRGGPR